MAKKKYEDYLKELQEKSKNLKYQPGVNTNKPSKNNKQELINTAKKNNIAIDENNPLLAPTIQSVSKKNNDRYALPPIGGFSSIEQQNRKQLEEEQENFKNKVQNTLAYEKYKKEVEERQKNERTLDDAISLAAKNIVGGAWSGVTNIANSATSELKNDINKAKKEGIIKNISDLMNATRNITNPASRAVDYLTETTKNAYESATDKNKTTKQKLGSYATKQVTIGTNTLTNPFSSAANESAQVASNIIGAKNSEKVYKGVEKIENKINAPVDEYNRKLQEENAKYGTKEQYLFGALNQVGNMIPSIATTAVTKNPTLGLEVMGSSAKGASIKEALAKGADLEQAIDIGNTKGAIEKATEMISGGVNIFGKGAIDDIVERGINKAVKNEVANFLIKRGIVDNAGEIAEETISDILGTLIDQGTVDPNAKYSIKDWSDTAITTVLSTLALNALTGGYGSTAFKQNAAAIQQQTALDNINFPTAETLKNNPNTQTKLSDIRTQIQNDYNQIKNTEGMNLSESATAYGLNGKSEAITNIQNLLEKRGIQGRYDASLFENSGDEAIWSKDSKGNRQVVFNPKASESAIIENIAMHEMAHDLMSSTNSRNALKSNELLNYVKTLEGYEEARKNLENTYSKVYDPNSQEFESLMNEEVVADMLGQKLGNQEFIQQLTTSKPGLAKTIYNWVVDKLNSIVNSGGKVRSERLYWENVKNNFEKAYRMEYENNSNIADTRFKSKVENNSEIEYNNETRPDFGNSLEGQEWYDFYKKIDNNGIENKQPGSKNRTIINDKIILSEHDGTRPNVYKVYQAVESSNEIAKKFNMTTEDIIQDIYKIAEEANVNEREIENYLEKYFDKGLLRRYDSNNNEFIGRDEETRTDIEPNNRSIREQQRGQNSLYETKQNRELDNSSFSLKQKQLDVINESNAAPDDYHTWIRNIEDINTFKEAFFEDGEYSGMDPDFTEEMANKALESGKVTVYSSYPIENGVFVSPSKMEAQQYAGGDANKLYSKEVNLDDVAWIDGAEGQYAKVDTNIKPLNKRVSGDKLLDTQDLIDEIKEVGAEVDENGYVTLYHQTTNENADKIRKTEKMSGKENGIFFSTSENASQADGRGTTKLKFKIPAEKLILDDLFEDNADLKINSKPGEQIDVSNYLVDTNSTSNEDIRYSKQNETWQRFLEDNFKSEGTKTKMKDLKLPTKEKINTPIKETKTKKVNIPLAKNNDVLRVTAEGIAKQINKNNDFNIKQRSWTETSTESDALKGKVFIEDLDPKKITYEVQTNKKSLDKANKHLDTYGYDKSLDYVKNLIQSEGLPKASDVALMQRMIQEASKRGDAETVQNLIMDTAILGTDLGQATQALSMIQRLTPEGQLKMYTKLVQRAKARGEKSFQNVEITPDMVQKVLEAYNQDGTYDQADLNARVEEFKQDLANQMKTTVGEKIDAWRYLSMLGNPKTHIRNVVSNVAMTGTVKVKNAMARTLETLIPIKERTKTWKKTSQEIKDYAARTTQEMKGIITGEGKYNEKSSIEAKKQIFKTKALEKISNLNSAALELEDWMFSSRAFKSTFQEYLTANGINTMEDVQNNPEIIQKAKNYAVEQAQIATFRQHSKLASMINKFENKSKIGKIATEALVPFKKTPINVAKAGVSYSPLGLIKNITYDAYQLKQGNINGSQFIDNISQGMTGTSLALLGYALAKAGVLSGSGSDDKEGKYDSQLGNTGYSVKLGDKSYTISWLSPVAMPMLVGANAYEQLEEGKEWDMNVVSDSLAKTLDPLNEMSFMQGVTNALNSYSSGVDKWKGIAESTAQNYVGQFFPTLLSQIASVTDDTKRSTKASANSTYKFGEQTLRGVMYKVPGLRQKLEPATDIWGNDKMQSDNILERAFETFIAPYSKNEDKTTDLDRELKRVYNEVGDSKVIPGIPQAYIKYGDETYRMSADEYTDYKKKYGQTANEYLNDLITSSSYQNASDDDKAKMIEQMYDYARAEANEKYFENVEDVSYQSKTLTELNKLKSLNITGDKLSEYVADTSEISTIRGNDAYSKEQKKKKTVDIILNSNFNNRQLAYLYDKYYSSEEELDNILNAGIPMKQFIKFDSQDFEGEFDERKGRTKTNSKKNEVLRYIDTLKLTADQKAFLAKSKYSSVKGYDRQITQYIRSKNISLLDQYKLLKYANIDTYDKEIVSYIANSDMSQSKKEKLYKQMGFTVYNGRVYVK